MFSVKNNIVWLAVLLGVTACNSDKPLTDQNYTLHSSYSIENLSNYPFSLSITLNQQVITLGASPFSGTIAPGERRSLLEFVDIANANNPPSASFEQLTIQADLGDGMRTVYQQVTDQDWQHTISSNSKENYLLTLVDADLAL
ncbi:hypothetical protein AHAT_28200 [Agarivorans sp. Toyoura001]|uniref:hypothetical protein n=1 Tax=Agarivorans sp. Toyoura001 TaxID=2283141 RepID=UPI0010EF5D03|nr:hypothetical protein [Agarivorans sp. Toyoura001]GDY26930.1 hypothetical protein AHAT_28200 [Agarivorans sp. Toyoura001]